MKDKNFLGSNIAIVLGILTLASSVNSITSGMQTHNDVAGLLIIFGALAYKARKKQNLAKSKNWFTIEIISVIIVMFNILIGFTNNNWYINPFTFVVIPLWIIIAYCIVLLKKKV